MSTRLLLLLASCFASGISQGEARYVTISPEKRNKPHRRFPRFTAPVARWCEQGLVAKNENDVDYSRDSAERCCEVYDKCDKFIPPHGAAYGLVNEDSFAVFHCDWDEKFYECLKNASADVGRATKKIRSMVRRGRCFREKPCRSGKTCEITEYEIVDEREWRIWKKMKSECYDVAASAEISCFTGVLRHVKFKFGLSVSEFSE